MPAFLNCSIIISSGIFSKTGAATLYPSFLAANI
jgi:hypothetical protein